MRGVRTFTQLITTQSTENDTSEPLPISRHSRQLSRRNDCIVARYYYYSDVRHLFYNDVVDILSLEFFLSTTTIAQLLLSHTTQIQDTRAEKPDLHKLKSVWPHLRW